MISAASVSATGLLTADRPVVVLFSGGADSTALIGVATELLGSSRVRALHVNYRLRVEADADELHCRRLCEALDIALSVERPAAPPPSGAGNVQARAREIRYSAGARLAAGRADLAVGHTADDQAETILYRLASSPSRRALLGMRPREGDVVRPLLAHSRQDTVAYCRAQGLDFVEDGSNFSPRYARNRIRAELLPLLRRIHPGAVANVVSVAETLRAEGEVLDELVSQTLGGATEIELQRLRALPPALAALVVQRLADAAAGGLAPGAARRIVDIAAMKDRGRSELDLPHGVRAVALGGVLSFTGTPKR